MKIRNSAHAVTLIELLVVMAIIAMLAGMLGLAVPSIGSKVNEYRAETDIKNLMAVLEFYRKDCGQYPDAINHNPGRASAQITDPNDVKPEPGAAYEVHIDERSNQLVQYTQLVWTLGSTRGGWSNPKLWDVFTRDKVNYRKRKNPTTGEEQMEGGQLIDPWGCRLFYMSCASYRRGYGGTILTGGNDAAAPFANASSYQIYSAGENRRTPPDKSNKAGTEPDDLRNW